MVWSSSLYMLAVMVGNGWRVPVTTCSGFVNWCGFAFCRWSWWLIWWFLWELFPGTAEHGLGESTGSGCRFGGGRLRVHPLLFLKCSAGTLHLDQILWVRFQITKREGRFEWSNAVLTKTYRKTKKQITTTPNKSSRRAGKLPPGMRKTPYSFPLSWVQHELFT